MTCALCLRSTAVAEDANRQTAIKSNGVIKMNDTFQQVQMDSSDLRYLAGQIDLLESSYKSTLSDSLSDVGQTTQSDVWSDLCDAVRHSQDVEAPATAEAISAGKQAWVQGKLITGTGANETAAYEKGYDDAYSSLPDLTVYFGMYGDDSPSNFAVSSLNMTVPAGYTKLTIYHDWAAWVLWVNGCGLNVTENNLSRSSTTYNLNYSGNSSINIRIQYRYQYYTPRAVFSRD